MVGERRRVGFRLGKQAGGGLEGARGIGGRRGAGKAAYRPRLGAWRAMRQGMSQVIASDHGCAPGHRRQEVREG